MLKQTKMLNSVTKRRHTHKEIRSLKRPKSETQKRETIISDSEWLLVWQWQLQLRLCHGVLLRGSKASVETQTKLLNYRIEEQPWSFWLRRKPRRPER